MKIFTGVIDAGVHWASSGLNAQPMRWIGAGGIFSGTAAATTASPEETIAAAHAAFTVVGSAVVVTGLAALGARALVKEFRGIQERFDRFSQDVVMTTYRAHFGIKEANYLVASAIEMIEEHEKSGEPLPLRAAENFQSAADTYRRMTF